MYMFFYTFPRRPRFLHYLIAKLSGYFWLPCERCGRMFGGHEVGYYDSGYLAAVHQDADQVLCNCGFCQDEGFPNSAKRDGELLPEVMLPRLNLKPLGPKYPYK